jgi:hypothetical protein
MSGFMRSVSSERRKACILVIGADGRSAGRGQFSGERSERRAVLELGEEPGKTIPWKSHDGIEVFRRFP